MYSNATFQNKDPFDGITLKIPHKKAFIYGIDVSDTVKAIGLEID